jgi:rhamnogalacturonan endolyase
MRTLFLFSLPLTVFAADLFRDDFSRYPPGVLSAPMGQLNGAIQEYHYIAHRGVPLGPWRNPIVHEDAWLAGDEIGKTYLEQHTIVTDKRYHPLFVTGDEEWADYAVEARVRPLSMAGMAGVVFRYRTSRHYYHFVLTEGKTARLALRLPVDKEFRVSDWRVLASAEFPYETTRYYTMRVENNGPSIRAFIDGKLVLEAKDNSILKGQAGVTATNPARFTGFSASAADSVAGQIKSRIAARDSELAKLRAANPKPKLWKKFDTPGWGAGRNVRFGDLDGDGKLDMLFAQNAPKVRGDAYDSISCLTAVTLDGKVLWQSGRPNPKNGLVTNDNPFQIHDLDGDGKMEVVLVRDFQLQVLDGRTGELKRWAWMPKALANARDGLPYELNNGDSFIFLNLSGKQGPREILLKDRYNGFWVFDSDLKFLWEGRAQTGHYPYPFDLDKDGKQEFVIGYGLWNHTGKSLWTHDSQMKDHPDAISMGNYSGTPNGPVRVYICGSDEGLVVINTDGSIHKQLRIGHTQTQSVGKYRPDLTGLQLIIANFWRNPGIVTVLDHDANILEQKEMVPGSTHLAPVNWRGDGTEFALLSGNIREGGMVDGHLRRVVMFPEDGHPDLAYHVADVTGDARDEVILWDQKQVWIYTQDRPFSGKEIYRPRRNPDYNESNYRATVSLPPQ